VLISTSLALERFTSGQRRRKGAERINWMVVRNPSIPTMMRRLCPGVKDILML
jgi:hypothetical protein